jgi:peroxiredoxin
MKKIHWLTILALLLNAAGLYFLFTGLLSYSYISFLAAYLSAAKDLQTYTSRFQVTVVLISALLFGIALDSPFEKTFWFTASSLLVGIAQTARVTFFTSFTQTRFRYFEPTLMALAAILFITKNLLFNENIFQWVLPAVQIFSTGFFVFGLFTDNGGLLKRAQKGFGVEPGKPAPDFVLPDTEKNIVKLSDYAGKRNVLLIFVRGDWCPWCHMMLRTYQKNIENFKEKNIFLIAVSPDDTEVNRDMAVKFGLEYKLLSDHNQAVTLQYGCRITHEEDTNLMSTNPAFQRYKEGIPLPASFLIDKNGIVLYTSRPDRVGEFLDPATIFPVLEKMT